jgi:hypothetical protein
MVAPFALFGIDNDGAVGVAANLLVIFLVAIWLALVYWTWTDARRRLTDSVLIGSAALAALIFPFAGSLVYAIVRPPETLDDAYERELDVRAAELRVRLLESAVKGGPGSREHKAAVAGETTGDPQGRKPAPSGRTVEPPQRGREQGSSGSQQPRRTPASGSSSSGPSRPSAPRGDRS